MKYDIAVIKTAELRYSTPYPDRQRATFAETRAALVKIKKIYLRNLSGSRERARILRSRVSSSRTFVVVVVALYVDINDLVDTAVVQRRAENGNIVSLMALKNLERAILRMRLPTPGS